MYADTPSGKPTPAAHAHSAPPMRSTPTDSAAGLTSATGTTASGQEVARV